MTPGVELKAPVSSELAPLLSDEALAFLAELHRRFEPRVKELLSARAARQLRLDAGESLDFLPETAFVREGEWRVAPIPVDLQDRRVEITGPVDRKMIINALNSGANVFMADFEDASSPTWDNMVQGQFNLSLAVRRELAYLAPETGKQYKLNPSIATLVVRPRGWHLTEGHMLVDGKAIPGGLFDFGLYFFHNAKELLARASGPYFYLPKLESHLEARLWNDVFLHAQKALGVARGSIRATVLIETLPAAFEMDEILYELREHSAGLNCGRWDYIFSAIKKRRNDPKAIMPNRASVTMDKGFLRAYSQLVIRTCHRRGIHAMGGMAAQIPIKSDPEANAQALAKVRADKTREAQDGHDGTWVAHPGLVQIAKEIFDTHMRGPNRIGRLREDLHVTREALLELPEGPKNVGGLRHNIRVGIQYIEAWLRGNGCVPLYNLMEDAATAEISRAQVWQWLHYRVQLDGGEIVSPELLGTLVEEELGVVRSELGDERFSQGRFNDARELFVRLSTAPEFEDFLTLPAYAMLRD